MPATDRRAGGKTAKACEPKPKKLPDYAKNFDLEPIRHELDKLGDLTLVEMRELLLLTALASGAGKFASVTMTVKDDAGDVIAAVTAGRKDAPPAAVKE